MALNSCICLCVRTRVLRARLCVHARRAHPLPCPRMPFLHRPHTIQHSTRRPAAACLARSVKERGNASFKRKRCVYGTEIGCERGWDTKAERVVCRSEKVSCPSVLVVLEQGAQCWPNTEKVNIFRYKLLFFLLNFFLFMSVSPQGLLHFSLCCIRASSWGSVYDWGVYDFPFPETVMTHCWWCAVRPVTTIIFSYVGLFRRTTAQQLNPLRFEKKNPKLGGVLPASCSGLLIGSLTRRNQVFRTKRCSTKNICTCPKKI